MQGSESTPAGRAASPASAASGFEELVGRIAIVIDGKTAALLAIEDGQARLTGGDGGDPRATILCRSLDDFRKVVRGERNLVVASLRGEVGVRGDLTFAIQVIRAIRSGMPFDGANVKGG
jgi:putative sterol carrier protein